MNHKASDLESYTETTLTRIIRDCWLEGTALYWERRAATFEAVGTPSADETAQACRNRAQVARWEVGTWE